MAYIKEAYKPFVEIVMHHVGEYQSQDVLNLYMQRWQLLLSPALLADQRNRAAALLEFLCSVQSGVFVRFKNKLYLGPACLHYPFVMKQLSKAEKSQIINYDTPVRIRAQSKVEAIEYRVLLLNEPNLDVQIVR